MSTDYIIKLILYVCIREMTRNLEYGYFNFQLVCNVYLVDVTTWDIIEI